LSFSQPDNLQRWRNYWGERQRIADRAGYSHHFNGLRHSRSGYNGARSLDLHKRQRINWWKRGCGRLGPAEHQCPGHKFLHRRQWQLPGFGGGTIGGDALIDVGAVNFSTGPLSDDIYNYLGGRIGNNASINLALSGALSVQGDTLFRILNYGNSDGLEGGQIGENATISVAAASIQAASLLAEINNSQGGQIGG